MKWHLDLFSGIGGFALAADWVWSDMNHVFCDNEPFAQAVLKKHWPNSTIYGDIRTLTADSYIERHLHGQSQEQSAEGQYEAQRQPLARPRPSALPEIDLLTGGFPCQPFSQAGRRRGTEDDRHLWPEMLRVIREFHPRWVVGENVGGFVTWNDGMVLEQVHADLEGEGYEVQAFIIPAVSVNAPHRRDRVWIVANSRSTQSRWLSEERRKGVAKIGKTDTNDTNPKRKGREGGSSKDAGRPRQLDRYGGDKGGDWNQNWLEVAARLCTLDDGLPNGLARPRGWRNAALKGAGNAIVPQVAAEIFKAIKELDS